MTSTISDGATSITPLQVTDYKSTRQSRNILHDVQGKAFPDATAMPAGPRTGTLTFLFGNEADALRCEIMHTGTAVLTFTDSDVSSAGMTYLADGSINRILDPQTRALWLVEVAFQEVQL